MKRQFKFAVLLGTLLMLTAALPIAHSAENTAVKIGRAVLVEGGQAVDVTVKATCPAGFSVLEAFVYVSQDGNQSTFGSIPLVCDGRPHRYTVRVMAFPDSPAFEPGPANASAYVLVLDSATGATQTAQDSRSIVIR